MSLEEQQAADRHLLLLKATEKIAEDYAARIMQLRGDPTSGPTVLLLIGGKPAKMIQSKRRLQPA